MLHRGMFSDSASASTVSCWGVDTGSTSGIYNHIQISNGANTSHQVQFYGSSSGFGSYEFERISGRIIVKCTKEILKGLIKETHKEGIKGWTCWKNDSTFGDIKGTVFGEVWYARLFIKDEIEHNRVCEIARSLGFKDGYPTIKGEMAKCPCAKEETVEGGGSNGN